MNARAVFFGLTLQHDVGHMSRAILEGVAYRLRSLKDALLETGVEVDQIFTSGGFTHSDLWPQIISSVLNRELLVTEWGETSSLGACFWAMLANGAISSFEDIAKLVRTTKTYQPVSRDADVYDRYFRLYMDLYFTLGDAFKRVGELSS